MPMTTLAGSLLAALFGAILGSFLNVVGHRLPRGESVVRPASRCPSCATPIKPYDNVPVLSWIVLRGRCRACRVPIPVRYPLVELVTALLCAAVLLDQGADRGAWLGLAFVVLLVPVTTIDLDHRIIPNVLMAIGAVGAIALLLATDAGALPEHLVAAVAAGGFLLVAALAYPGGMGMGDVKLAAGMGLFLGRDVAAAMLVALVAGPGVGGLIIARKGPPEGPRNPIPVGPVLVPGWGS